MDGVSQVFNTLKKVIHILTAENGQYVRDPSRDFTRNRKISFEILVDMILRMAGNSLNLEVDKYFNHAVDAPTTSAFVQQRSKLSYSFFEDVFKLFNQECTDSQLFHGYRLLAVDGTDINLPRNPEDAGSFIKPHNCEGYNLLHANMLLDLMSKTYFDCILQPKKKSDEQGAMFEMLSRNDFRGKNIVIMDRGYESYNTFGHFLEMKDVHCICRVRQGKGELRILQGIPMRECDQMISRDVTTTQTNEDKRMKRIYICNGSTKGKTLSPNTKTHRWDQASPYTLNLRVVRFRIADNPNEYGDIEGNPNNYETLITTLPQDEFSVQEMKELYHMRWGIETSFRELKYACGLMNLHAKSKNSIYQEIFAHLIMYNFAQRIIQSAVISKSEESARKYQYQVNFTLAIQLCRSFYAGNISAENILVKIRKHILPIRPGRKDKRNLHPTSFVSFLYRVAA